MCPRNNFQDTSDDLAKSGIVVSKKTITKSPAQECTARLQIKKTPLLQKRHLQARLQYAKDNLEKDYADWNCVLWSEEMEPKLVGHRDIAYIWRKKGEE